ncbi:MAG: response regulator receiver protein [Deltaproteobacteria bacterium]|nr:response regulator receiver protein [Deltaproteobacteria bacterium]
MTKIVLCVDDSATMQQVADITFRGTAFTYVGARTYDEGLEKTKSQKPAVVLADSMMPGGKSGYDLCMAIKSNDATSEVPVVILVGNGAPYDNTKGVQVGADANLPKPWDTQTMLEKVTEVVTKAEASGVAKPGQGAAATAATVPASVSGAPSQPLNAPKPAPSAAMAPRSATIMGMPTIKLPAGVAPAVGPAKASAMAVPPIAAPAPAVTTPGPTPATMRAPAPPAPSSVAVASPALASTHTNRAPMISGTPTKRSALVERTLAKMAARLAEATGLEPGSPELLALLKLSTEVVERIVWEVVPELAEQIIRENLNDLTARRS